MEKIFMSTANRPTLLVEGHIVSLNAKDLKNSSFEKVLLTVAAVKPWGVIGFVHIPSTRIGGIVKEMWYRASWHEIFTVVGINSCLRPPIPRKFRDTPKQQEVFP